ncbi:MAG: hypothetical protein ACRD4S_11695 [Candidatus Acidiferrales bacterium]
MSGRQNAIGYGAIRSLARAEGFAPLGARRMLVIGGIALILAGMLFGDVFAAFILHPNADRIGESLLAATHAVAARDAQGAAAAFQNIGGFLENRGTKVDAHVHMIGFGYLALLLALLQPFVDLSERRKKFLAKLFLAGSVLLPVCVFLIHYTGLAFSPFKAIGWASIFADLGGLLVFVVCIDELAGLWKHLRRQPGTAHADELLSDRSWPGRVLLVGGTLLVLLGFLQGAYYAGANLYRYEAKDAALLSTMADKAATGDSAAAAQAVADYGQLQAAKAVNVAAHAHFVEFGVLAILLAFFQPYVFLRERWVRIWSVALLLGSFILPFFVLMELHWGLIAGGIADAGGLLVVVALLAMLAGIWRYTGKLDAVKGVS